jgi:hypothetical protein
MAEADVTLINVPLEDAIMTEAYPPPLSTLESIDTSRPQEQRMNIAFLCNPSDEHPNLRSHHISQISSNDLDDVERRTLAKECNCEWTLIMLIT